MHSMWIPLPNTMRKGGEGRSSKVGGLRPLGRVEGACP